jgi:hypothetical protein
MIGLPALGGRRAVQVACAAALLLTASVVLGWRAGRETTAAAASAAPTQWTLPGDGADNPERDAAILRARRPWGGGNAFHDIDSGPVIPTVQPWTLVGTIVRDDRRYALIRVGPPSSKIEYRGIGEKLPDGSTVDAIDADGITTAGGSGRGAKPIVYRLFTKKS